MESDNLTTRTYATPTCTLIVANQAQQSLTPFAAARTNPVDFILHLEDPDRDGSEAITLQGKPQQLDHLQQVVSNYVAELIAKFPLPTGTDRLTSLPTRSPQSDTVPQPLNHPDSESPRSGLVKNLPGLPTNNPSPFSLAANNADPRSPVPPQSMFAKLFGRSTDRQTNQNSRPNDPLVDLSGSPAVSQNINPPYLTRVGDRSLDHQLHLGNLATMVSGEILTLSAIQLFDLATVLDEYVTAPIPTPNQPPTQTPDRDRLRAGDSPIKAVFTTATSLSRLPNLPKIPTPIEHSPVYARTRRSRSSFVSAIPWAMASAIAVGVPLLLLDPKPNPLKDFTSKVKPTDSADSKTSQIAKVPTGKLPIKPGRSVAKLPTTATSPTPWQAQPVQPPSVNKPLNSGGSTSQNSTNLGSAQLPAAIGSRSGKNLPTTTGRIGSGAENSVAPNALLPSDLNQLDNSTKSPTKPTAASAKSGREAAATRTKPSATSQTIPNTTTIGQLPIEDANLGKISVASQPTLTPPADLAPAISANPNDNPQAPLTPNQASMSGGIDPVTSKPKSPKKTAKSKVKPKTPTSKPQPQPSASPNQQEEFEPFTPVPRNPNLIDPEQNNNAQSSEPKPQPIVPNQPFPSTTESSSAAEPASNPSLQETKRFFQSKWKADTAQPNPLQYVLQVSGKSGVIRSVEPQGEAASAYLQQSKLIEPGQKLISPAAAGNNDQKIRVLLQPDGNVDTLVEP